MKDKKITKRNCKKVCLELWKRLSHTRKQNKLSTLEEMGYSGVKNSCPLCEIYWLKPTCPIGDCNIERGGPCEGGTPYMVWSLYPTKKTAGIFYRYLKTLFRKQKTS